MSEAVSVSPSYPDQSAAVAPPPPHLTHLIPARKTRRILTPSPRIYCAVATNGRRGDTGGRGRPSRALPIQRRYSAEETALTPDAMARPGFHHTRTTRITRPRSRHCRTVPQSGQIDPMDRCEATRPSALCANGGAPAGPRTARRFGLSADRADPDGSRPEAAFPQHRPTPPSAQAATPLRRPPAERPRTRFPFCS